MPREFKIVSILPGCLLVFSGLFTVSLCGQIKDVVATGDQAVYGADGSVQVPLTDEAQFGVMLHTQGVGLTARRGFYQNAFLYGSWGIKQQCFLLCRSLHLPISQHDEVLLLSICFDSYK